MIRKGEATMNEETKLTAQRQCADGVPPCEDPNLLWARALRAQFLAPYAAAWPGMTAEQRKRVDERIETDISVMLAVPEARAALVRRFAGRHFAGYSSLT
jgi:hypothetical protein